MPSEKHAGGGVAAIGRRPLLQLAAAQFLPAAAAASSKAPRVAAPRTEYRENPMGVETENPAFSWRLAEPRIGVQTAYRVTVARDEASLALGTPLLWDSGEVNSDTSVGIRYGGGPPGSGERLCWQVVVRDQNGTWSEPARGVWEMGLLAPGDWQARWLAAEDAEQAADREAAPAWIWAGQDHAAGLCAFLLAFDAGAASQARLLLAAKDRLEAGWLNGAPLALPPPTSTAGSMADLLLAPPRAGPNQLVLILRSVPDPFNPYSGGGLCALLKLSAAGGAPPQRVPSGPAWQAMGLAGQAVPTAPPSSGWATASPAAGRLPEIPWPPGPALLMRGEFTIPGPIRRARLRTTALGAYQPWLNGMRVGSDCLAPEASDTRDHVFYQTYDVTSQLRQGRNALGAIVADGWYASALSWNDRRYSFGPAPRRFLARLDIEAKDGTATVFTTGAGWRASTSAVRTAEIYNGESYDARYEQPGWCEPGFDDSNWFPAREATPPRATLRARPDAPIKAFGRLAPVAETSPEPGRKVFDFGQNFAGWCAVSVRGPRGGEIVLRFAERLDEAGRLDTRNLRGAHATDRYVLRGDPKGETWEPSFTYHGFRYAEATVSAGVEWRALHGVVAHTDLEPTGEFRVDEARVQSIWHNALWSQRANFFGLPTDCPQRDERMGWLGDAQVFWDAACFNMGADSFTRRFLMEVRAGQSKAGAYPVVAPAPGFETVSPGWSGAGVILPWTAWQHYGDTRIIEENWAAMSRWSAFLHDRNPDFLWRNGRGLDLGDWLAPFTKSPHEETTPHALIATAFWAYETGLMAEMADAIGRSGEAAVFRRMADAIGLAFRREWVRPDGSIGNGSQTSFILALRFGLLPEALRPRAAALLAADILRRGTHLSTGFLGTPYSLDALTDHGYAALAVDLLLQSTFPSWGYMTAHGATTMWERWDGDRGDPAMNSFNHYAFGAVAAFLYRRIGGIAPARPGFTKIRLAPVLDARLGTVSTTYISVCGPIATVFTPSGAGRFHLAVSIPPNCSASLILPSGLRPAAIPAGAASGATPIELGPGDWAFEAAP